MKPPDATPITPANESVPTGSPAATLRGVTFGYGAPSAGSTGGGAVLSGVSVDLMPGRVTVVLGPNASGKSTLVKVMLGQLRPWTGTVEVGGRAIRAWDGRELARRVSYVPQRGGARFAFTVRQTIAMGRFAFGDERHVDAAVEKFGLADVAERPFNELSGGQQQRVLIARAWTQSRGRASSCETRILLADEPASNLDLRHAHAAMAVFREMADEGMAVLVVLHGLDLATRWADDVWLMDRGRVVAQGAADEVLEPETLGPVYGLELDRLEHAGQHFLVVKPDDLAPR